MRLRGVFVAVVAVVWVATAREASASSPEVDVAWTAPVGCPDAATVRADVVRLGGTARPGARAIATATTRDGKWTATIAIEDGDARRARTIHAKSCAELAEAAALVVAMALRDAPAPDPEPPSPRAPHQPPPPKTTAPTEQTARETPRMELPGRFAIGAGIQGLTGALPSIAPAAGGWIAWLPGRARFEVSAYGTSAQSALAPGAATGAELRMLGGAARACWMAFVSQRVGVGPCAGVEGLRVASRGVGMTSPRDAITWGSAGAVGAHAYLAAYGSVAVTISGDALVPVARPRYVEDGAPTTVLHRAAPVWGRLVLGGEVRF